MRVIPGRDHRPRADDREPGTQWSLSLVAGFQVRRDELLRHPQHSVGSGYFRIALTHANHATTRFGWSSQQKRIPNKGAGGDAGLPMAIITCAIIDLVAIALFFGLCIFLCP